MTLLLAIVILQYKPHSKIASFFSGIFLGFMFFSSPTSTLYFPYYFGFLFFHYRYVLKTTLKDILIHLLFILSGALLVVLYITLPNPIEYFKKFNDFLLYSKKGNDFIRWKTFLSSHFPIPDGFRGGGWIWVIKYIWLIMPIMITVYAASLLYLLKISFRKPWVVAIILLTLSTPILVEIIRVAQFGRNYFSWIIGIILGICCACAFLKEIILKLPPLNRKLLILGFALLLFSHIKFNIYTFFDDVLPSRLATTKIHRWLIRHHIDAVATYKSHPYIQNVVQFMNNPKQKDEIAFIGIDSLTQMDKGFVLIPPMTGKSIWCSCIFDNVEDHPWIIKLMNSGELNDYVVKSFKTVSSSRIWAQEEEVCSYRDLILGQVTDQDRWKGRAWILNAEKLHRKWFSHPENQNL